MPSFAFWQKYEMEKYSPWFCLVSQNLYYLLELS